MEEKCIADDQERQTDPAALTLVPGRVQALFMCARHGRSGSSLEQTIECWHVKLQRDKQIVCLYFNREQAPNPHYDWTSENLPVTKLTGCNVSASMLP